MKILHISDLHVGKTDSEQDNLKTIIDAIVGNDWKDDKPVILITGDFVDDGNGTQFKKVQENLKVLYERDFSVLPIPGNHDYGKNGNHAEQRNFEYFKQYILNGKDVVYPCVNDGNFGGHVLIGLNSMKGVFRDIKVDSNLPDEGIFAGNSFNSKDAREIFFASGKLGSDQINALSHILDGLKSRPAGKCVILYVHHHPFLFHKGRIREMGEKFVHSLVDGDELMGTIQSRRVDMLLFGHEHLHYDFSNNPKCLGYNIKKILCSGKSTGGGSEYDVNNEGEVKIKSRGTCNQLLGRIIEIDPTGNIVSKSVEFLNGKINYL